MSSQIKWSALGTYTTLIAGASSAPTLKNIATGTQVLGNTVTNATDRNQYCDLVLQFQSGVAPSTSGIVEVYFIPSLDGTNYSDGDATIAPPYHLLVAAIPLRAVTTAQRIHYGSVRLPPCDFKPLVINKSGQTTANTDNVTLLSFRTYNDEAQ
jgi:hypothetical protein